MLWTREVLTVSLISISGKFIPASQRPDGTWRKARRVKDGYVPQEEVPLYESKGKQFAKKPDLPVGMCPLVAKAAREKRERQQQKQNKQQQPGLINLPTNQQQQAASHASSKKDKQRQQTQNSSSAPNASGGGGSSKKSSAKSSRVASLSNGISNLDLSSEEDVQKQLKKLRKKIREIETIEGKLKAGELKVPEQDQLDKVARKSRILKEIQELEALESESGP